MFLTDRHGFLTATHIVIAVFATTISILALAAEGLFSANGFYAVCSGYVG
jgi:hypothetical protein